MSRHARPSRPRLLFEEHSTTATLVGVALIAWFTIIVVLTLSDGGKATHDAACARYAELAQSANPGQHDFYAGKLSRMGCESRG